MLNKTDKALENPISKSQNFWVEMTDEYWDEVKSGAVKIQKKVAKS